MDWIEWRWFDFASKPGRVAKASGCKNRRTHTREEPFAPQKRSRVAVGGLLPSRPKICLFIWDRPIDQPIHPSIDRWSQATHCLFDCPVDSSCSSTEGVDGFGLGSGQKNALPIFKPLLGGPSCKPSNARGGGEDGQASVGQRTHRFASPSLIVCALAARARFPGRFDRFDPFFAWSIQEGLADTGGRSKRSGGGPSCVASEHRARSPGSSSSRARFLERQMSQGVSLFDRPLVWPTQHRQAHAVPTRSQNTACTPQPFDC
jgi:hypothetical protein